MTKYSEFSRNFKKILYDRQLLQVDVANRLGVDKSTVSGWCTGKAVPRGDLMAQLLQILGVSLEDLTGASQTAPAKGSVLRVPILGRIPAGVPLEMIEDVEGYEEIPWRPGEFFGLRVRGSSMAPAIQDGDLVILKKQEDVENGQIAAVSIGGEDATLKKVQKVDGHVVLLPLNPAYDPMLFPASSVRILGLLVESKRVWA